MAPLLVVDYVFTPVQSIILWIIRSKLVFKPLVVLMALMLTIRLGLALWPVVISGIGQLKLVLMFVKLHIMLTLLLDFVKAIAALDITLTQQPNHVYLTVQQAYLKIPTPIHALPHVKTPITLIPQQKAAYQNVPPRQ